MVTRASYRALEQIKIERSETTMKSLLLILSLGSVDTATAQGGVPTIDVGPSCKAAAAGTTGAQDVDSCRRSEQAVRANRW